jgi:thymidylate synthase
MIAQITKLKPGTFTHSIGDAHLYLNHIDLAKEMLKRECAGLPILKLNPAVKDIDKFRFIDVTIEGYNPHPTIKAPVSV